MVSKVGLTGFPRAINNPLLVLFQIADNIGILCPSEVDIWIPVISSMETPFFFLVEVLVGNSIGLNKETRPFEVKSNGEDVFEIDNCKGTASTLNAKKRKLEHIEFKTKDIERKREKNRPTKWERKKKRERIRIKIEGNRNLLMTGALDEVDEVKSLKSQTQATRSSSAIDIKNRSSDVMSKERIEVAWPINDSCFSPDSIDQMSMEWLAMIIEDDSFLYNNDVIAIFPTFQSLIVVFLKECKIWDDKYLKRINKNINKQ